MTLVSPGAVPVRRAVMVAAFVVALLALGPFVIPLVADGPADGVASMANPVDHRNDFPVVRPDQPARSSTIALRLRAGGIALLVMAFAGLLVGAPSGRSRPARRRAGLRRRPAWSQPPRRGPPLLLAG